jgi:hypothetical protein
MGAEVHVVPVARTGRWLVQEREPALSESEFETETAAELAALARARTRGGGRIVIHDRYHRTREIAAEHARA